MLQRDARKHKSSTAWTSSSGSSGGGGFSGGGGVSANDVATVRRVSKAMAPRQLWQQDTHSRGRRAQTAANRRRRGHVCNWSRANSNVLGGTPFADCVHTYSIAADGRQGAARCLSSAWRCCTRSCHSCALSSVVSQADPLDAWRYAVRMDHADARRACAAHLPPAALLYV
jgi:hypothetical protein